MAAIGFFLIVIAALWHFILSCIDPFCFNRKVDWWRAGELFTWGAGIMLCAISVTLWLWRSMP